MLGAFAQYYSTSTVKRVFRAVSGTKLRFWW
jgi:hypothetical protein